MKKLETKDLKIGSMYYCTMNDGSCGLYTLKEIYSKMVDLPPIEDGMGGILAVHRMAEQTFYIVKNKNGEEEIYMFGLINFYEISDMTNEEYINLIFKPIAIGMETTVTHNGYIDSTVIIMDVLYSKSLFKAYVIALDIFTKEIRVLEKDLYNFTDVEIKIKEGG